MLRELFFLLQMRLWPEQKTVGENRKVQRTATEPFPTGFAHSQPELTVTLMLLVHADSTERTETVRDIICTLRTFYIKCLEMQRKSAL